MKIAAITVTFNSADTLTRHWKPCTNPKFSWIVIDNASRDGTAQTARSLGAEVVELSENIGFSGANNIGATVASDADCLVFVNPDITLDADGLQRLAEEAVHRQCIAAPQLLNHDGSMQENGRRMPYLYRKILHFFNMKGSRTQYEVFAGLGEIVPATWAIGAAIAIPADLFRKIGGWDDRFFLYYEDSDICLRASRMGIPTYLVGDVRWHHGWKRETRRSLNLAAWRREVSSALKFYGRYPPLLLHPRIAPRRFKEVGELCV
ncbi:glycosyltransferase family 2 protein [Nocardioides sp.]|uniref:glycosyltransferase family 2 protein n=1 Tax=Nocardioides sp. TaxID=35761 RepID=UPI0026347C6C|nr:glycosyltransferase family 2 protein [Nocardioides sp.]